MDRIALVVSITNGQDLQIAERMRRKLRASYSEVQIFDVSSAADADSVSIKNYDGVILGVTTNGSAIPPYFAKWVGNNSARLNGMPFAFFSISPSGEQAKDSAPMDRMVVWFLESVGLRPHVAAEFAGAPEEKTSKPAGLFQRSKPAVAAPKKDFPYDWNAISSFVDAFEATAYNSNLGKTDPPMESMQPGRSAS